MTIAQWRTLEGETPTQDREGATIDELTGEPLRIFTLEEARDLLPVLKDLFARFGRARKAAADVVGALEALEQQRSRANTLELARPLRERREELGEQVEEMRSVVRTVQEMGVEIKHLDPALIDFPWLRNDRIVYLCWQEGEENIVYWHDVDAGFAGRTPL